MLHGLVHMPLVPRGAVFLGTERGNVVGLTTTVAHFASLGKAGLRQDLSLDALLPLRAPSPALDGQPKVFLIISEDVQPGFK